MPVPELLDKPGLIRFGIWLANALPQQMGRRLARAFAVSLTLNPAWPKVEGVRANQRMIAPQASQEEIERRVRGVFRHSGGCLFDFYRSLGRKRPDIAPVEFSAPFRAIMDRQRRGEAQFLVIPHTSNFDLIGGAATEAGMKMQVLTYAKPPAAYRLDNQLRAQVGLEATPVSLDALRKAMVRLRGGGTVLTAVDRPPDGPPIPREERPLFFGHPANLSIGYLRLAAGAKAPLAVVAVHALEREGYSVWASDLIDPPLATDLHSLMKTAELILAIIEQFLHRFPTQWRMFYPVWPDSTPSIQGT